MNLEDRSTQTGTVRSGAEATGSDPAPDRPGAAPRGPADQAADATRPITATRPADVTRPADATGSGAAAKPGGAVPGGPDSTAAGLSAAPVAPEHPAARDGDAERVTDTERVTADHSKPAVDATDTKPPVTAAPAAGTTEASGRGSSTAGPSDTGSAGPAASTRLRERWQEALLSFVDDPRGAVRQADQVLDEAVTQLTEAVRREQDRLRAAWREDGAPSTDTLRDALRGYRDFLERLASTPR